ncbi:MAG: HEAT repeat domain-containing protein [Deltaproteobacteria bacterium]|nr:HEAT repeat domain-containing protein [Deltaproteobacteria bacterium]
MTNPQSSVNYTHYLQNRSTSERLATLKAMQDANQYVPISVAEDLLSLDLLNEEKLAILSRTGSRDGLALEHFLINQIAHAPQELAVSALRLWAEKTDNLLWFRMLQVIKSPLVSQRLFYTIVDLAQHTGGAQLLRVAAGADGIEEMSTALHGLLLQRACQWRVDAERLRALANRSLQQGVGILHPDDKSMVSALGYLAMFHPLDLQTFVGIPDFSEPWRDVLRVIIQSGSQAKVATKNVKSKSPSQVALDLPTWPPLWRRHELSDEAIAAALAASQTIEPRTSWEVFAGIPAERLVTIVAKIEDHKAFAVCLANIIGLVPSPVPSTLLENLRTRLTTSENPADLLTALPLRIRLDLTDETSTRSSHLPFAAVKREQAKTLSGEWPIESTQFRDYVVDGTAQATATAEDPLQLAQRKRFFAHAYEQKQVTPASGDDFFTLLVDSWQKPSEQKLDKLASVSRQVDGLFKICYINTLGRFHGQDQAVLKLMDFVRSQDGNYLRAVVQSLGEIGTPRAAQELIACLTRPNFSANLQVEICTQLKNLDLTNLQNELLAALNDLNVTEKSDPLILEVRDMLTGLLQISANNRPVREPRETGSTVEISDTRLDQELGGKIPNYRELSSEVKRALRTALFFHIQTTANSAPSSIDLSPVIDMQYKSLELLFRETYEEPCSRLMHTGVLQRRLDIIGYARPIPKAMDDFEHFIETLPIVREIPFFSNFKLRKMLRAICQFRPGKRFTLDGLKAFALFFLCFSRTQCPYSLNGMFGLGFKDDLTMFQFCKSLHVFQDFRNRAAHEGFHPDAANDIDGIWRSTAEIVQTVFQTKAYLDSGATGQGDQGTRNRPAVIIEKKVS